MTSQVCFMNLVNLPPQNVVHRTAWTWPSNWMSKFQGSSYRKHWCANCRLPVPSDDVPCPTCGVRAEVMSSDRVPRAAESSTSSSKEGHSRQPVAGGAEDRGLHLPPIGSNAHDVSGELQSLALAPHGVHHLASHPILPLRPTSLSEHACNVDENGLPPPNCAGSFPESL